MPRSITPAEAAELVHKGATLVDIREPGEFARARIPGAVNLPLSRLADAALEAGSTSPVIFHCLSGTRTRINAGPLDAKAGKRQAFLIAGGLNAWRRAGLPVEETARAAPGLARQVRFTAAAIVALGVLLGATVSPGFYLASVAVIWGVLMPDTCWLMPILRRMPWNRGGDTGVVA